MLDFFSPKTLKLRAELPVIFSTNPVFGLNSLNQYSWPQERYRCQLLLQLNTNDYLNI